MKIKEVITEGPGGSAGSQAGAFAKKAGQITKDAAKKTVAKAGQVAKAGIDMSSDAAKGATGIMDRMVDKSAVASLTKTLMKKWNQHLRNIKQATINASKAIKTQQPQPEPQPQAESKQRKIKEDVAVIPSTKIPKYPETKEEFDALLTQWMQNMTGKPLADITGGAAIPNTTVTEMLRGFFYKVAEHLIAQQRQKTAQDQTFTDHTSKIANEVKEMWEKLKSTTPTTTPEEYIRHLKRFFDSVAQSQGGNA